MFRKLIAPAALACLALGATQANADTVRVDGFAGGYETLTISLFAPNAAKSEFGEAGGLATTLVGVGSFTAYCADLYQNISLNTTYTGFTPVAGSAHTFANANANNDLGKLFSEGVVLNSATSQAAFQIAIWEISYETTGKYDVLTGAATFTGGTAASSGALTLADTWLAALATTTNKVSLTVLESPTNQDLLVTTPVPEPSTYALMGAGLLTVSFLARRRSPKQG